MRLSLRGFVAATALVGVLLGGTTLPAGADPSDAQILNQSIVVPAGQDLRNLQGTIAQAKPIGEVEKPLTAPGLPQGLSYTLDFSSAFPLGSTGKNNVGLPGGFDGVLAYGITPNIRLSAGYYQLQEYPIGFDTGSVPVILRPTGTVIGYENLHTAQQDVTIKNGIFVGSAQFLVPLPLPLVVSPTYIARWGTIGGHSDLTLIDVNGRPTLQHLRTFQQYLIPLTIPLISSPKLFATFTIAPQWVVNPSSVNQNNNVQLFQLFYIEYRANKKTTFYFQPSVLRNYLPSDQYPQHIPTMLYGLSYKFAKPFFIQAQVSSGVPTNPPGGQTGRIGVVSISCYQLPCAPNTSQTAPDLGGLKAAQIQLMIGIGTPSVIPL